MTTTTEKSDKAAVDPALKLNFYSHATLDCRDIAFTRSFFEEFLGFEVVQMAKIAFWARLGGNQVIVVVQNPNKDAGEMPFLNHNGLDVATEGEVDEAHAIVERGAEKMEAEKNYQTPRTAWYVFVLFL